MSVLSYATRALTITVIGLATVCQAAEPGGLSAGLTNPGYHDKPSWFKLSFLDIRDDVNEAAAAGKRVMLYFYQDGCPYCKKLLEDNFGQRTIVAKTRRHFDVIAINMWGDREVTGLDGKQTTEKRFASALRVMFTPTLLFLDEQGRVVLRVNGYYFPAKFDAALDYVSSRMESKLSFRDYYAGVAPEPATGKLHHDPAFLKPPYDLTGEGRTGGRYLLVLFEQKRCKPCDELHLDILQRPATREELKHLDVVSLDMWSTTPVVTPRGQSTTAAQWARQLNIKFAPSMVFFGPSGREVFRTEAYLKSFHIQGSMAYVYSGAYLKQPNFQRFLKERRAELEANGARVDLME